METREARDQARKESARRYNYLRACAVECRQKAEKAHTVADAMRLVRQADDFAARAYHEVA